MSRLIAHPEGGAAPEALSVEATVIERSGPILKLRYTLSRALDQLRIPPPADPVFELGLWEHTCLELFVAAEDEDAYHEFNFSPSGRWALLGFRGYRDGAAIDDPDNAPQLDSDRAADELVVEVTVDLGRLAARYARASLDVGLSAVIESRGGELSYWAMRHPSAVPDFHHRDGFDLRVEAKSPA